MLTPTEYERIPLDMTRSQHNTRKNRESVSKRLGKTARLIKERDNHSCVYCGANHGPMHLDHVVARSMGGPDTAGNLVVACASCNCVKRNLTVRQFFAFLRIAHGWTAQQTKSCGRRLRRQLAKKLKA